MTLMKMVVMTNMLVRFTERAASKKKGLKKVVANVIIIRRTEGRKVVIISLVIFLFKTIFALIPLLPPLKVLLTTVKLSM